MSIGAQVTYLGNVLQQRLSTALVWLADAIAFLSRTVWPLVDLLIRIWIGRQALVLSVLISTDWAMAVSMATGSYPIPVAGLGSTALLSLLYWLAAVSLILGLATRVSAAVLLALAVASHIRVAALDLNLFWIALLAYYVLLGADRLSLDRLVSQGLKSSSLPQVGALITVLDAARPAGDDDDHSGDLRVVAHKLCNATLRRGRHRAGPPHWKRARHTRNRPSCRRDVRLPHNEWR